MNAKLKRLSFTIALAFLSLLILGCSMQEKTETEKTMIINKDVQLESSLADSSLKIARLDDILVRENSTHPESRLGFSDEKIYYSENNHFFTFDINTSTKEIVIDRNVFKVSASADYVLSFESKESQDPQAFVHNLQNGEAFLLTHGSLNDADYDFANAKGDEVASFNHTTNTVTLENVDTNKMKTWHLNGLDYSRGSYVRKVGNDLFLIARSEKEIWGIYQLKEQGKVDHVTGIPGRDTLPHEVHFLKNNTVLFNGLVDGEEGIFLLDLATDHLEELVPAGVDAGGNPILFPAYSLSPDESKIIFSTFVQVGDDYKSNVYIGKIDNGELVDTVRIMEHTDLYAVNPISGSWSKDSKRVYIEISNENEAILETVAVFEVE